MIIVKQQSCDKDCEESDQATNPFFCSPRHRPETTPKDLVQRRLDSPKLADEKVDSHRSQSSPAAAASASAQEIMKKMLEKNNQIRQKQQSVDKPKSPGSEFKSQLRDDKQRLCAVTEKLTFEICASLIAFEVKNILGTIKRPENGQIRKPNQLK